MQTPKISKQQAASEVSNQEALVKKLMGTSYRQPVRTVIPGGAKLLDVLDKERFPEALKNWLCKHRWFEWTRICFAKDIKGMNLDVQKVEDFGNAGKVAPWEMGSKGKRWLAARMSFHLLSGKYVYVEARKDGLYGAALNGGEFSADGDNWEPHQLALPVKRGTYA